MQKTDTKEQLLKASGNYFMKKGYKQTQVSDIAKASLISTGTVYNYFTSKKALYDYTLYNIFDVNNELSINGFPIEPIDHEALIPIIVAPYDARITDLTSILSMEESDLPSLKELIGSVFDFMDFYWQGISIIERNNHEWIEISNAYNIYRDKIFQALTKVLKRYVQCNKVIELDNPFYHTRYIIENLAWWGMHRKKDSDETFRSIPTEEVKQMIVNLLVRSYKK